MTLIDAMFINKGGGAVLLDYLIEHILAHTQSKEFYFLLDPRYKIPTGLGQEAYTIIPNKIKERIKYYKQNRGRFSKVFCFANTPPPINLKIPSYTYMHNQKILEAPKQKLNRKYWSMYAKYLFVKMYNKNTNYYIVQTKHMVDELVGIGLKDDQHCLTIPFYDDCKYQGGGKPFAQRGRDEFVFISNPSPQKNYPTLLDTWEYLLDKGITPKLHVTVDDTGPSFLERIKALNARGARIENHVYVDPHSLYFNCPYLIFPSIMESFGLPLIEAVDSGMKVIASDLTYVHDVITPSLTFQPYDKKSMADAVIKAMNTELPFPKVVTHNEIVKLVELIAP